MNIITLVDKIITAISTNAALIMWCGTNYKKPPTIYKGIDLRKPPPSSECPVINVIPIKKNPNESMESVPHIVGVICQVHEDQTIPPSTTTTIDGVVIKEYVGIDNIEEFRKAVENAITAIAFNSDPDLVGLRVNEIKIDYDTIEVFPFFRCFMEIEFMKILSQGEDTWA